MPRARRVSSSPIAPPDVDPDDVAGYLAAVKAGVIRRPGAETGLVWLGTVKPQKVRWLWRGYIPRGKITLIDGDPGTGKSTLALDIAARVTTGRSWPDGARGGQGGNVLLMTAEEALADTVAPRILLAGGLPEKVAVLTHIPAVEGAPERLPGLPADVPYISHLVRKHKVRLLIVDVLASYLGGGGGSVNSHQDSDVRRALYPVSVMAEQTGTAVLLLRHLNKAAALSNPLYRGGGSIGITGQARAVYLAAIDPDDQAPDVNARRRIFCPVKNNCGPLMPPLAYSLAGEPDDVARIEWHGGSAHTAEQLLGIPLDEDEREDREQVSGWVQDYLFHQGGTATFGDILAASRKHGIAERTLRRSRKRAGVTFRRAGWQGGTIWVLNPDAMTTMQEESHAK